MRSVNTFVERYRLRSGPVPSDESFGNNGQFLVPHGDARLLVQVSDGAGWDHISVSLPDRCPTWTEMQYVRELWFSVDEWVVQYSPPRHAHISHHPFCLHLWRRQNTAARDEWLPVPPAWMVAPREGN